mmetsp:Transcript_21735/g.34851  ORF Transcript_21735/g.34851 Transcript_21735/m.34851 type:complete len:514 (-) Transcript_21735:2-1543(-)
MRRLNDLRVWLKRCLPLVCCIQFFAINHGSVEAFAGGLGARSSIQHFGSPSNSRYGIPLKPFCRKSAMISVLKLADEQYGAFIFQGDGWNLTSLGRNSSHVHHSTVLTDGWAYSVPAGGGAEAGMAALLNGSAAPAAVGWPWAPLPTPAPTPRWKAGFATRPGGGGGGGGDGLLVFGGYKYPRDGGSHTTAEGFLGDLWRFAPNGSAWEQVVLPSLPSARRSHLMAATESNDSLIFGGKTSDQLCNSDLFIWYNGSNEGYEQKASFPGPCRWGQEGKLVKIADEDYFVFFGGRNRLPETGHHYVYYDELWGYNMNEDEWAVIESVDGVIPNARDHSSMFWVEEENSIYVFGGKQEKERESAVLLNDLWRFSFDQYAWEQLAPGGDVPSPRYLFSYDVWRGADGRADPQLLVFGGAAYVSAAMSVKYNDAYLYSIKDNLWTRISNNTCDDMLEPLNAALGTFFKLFFLGAALVVLAVGLLAVLVRCGRQCCCPVLKEGARVQPQQGGAGYHAIG